MCVSVPALAHMNVDTASLHLLFMPWMQYIDAVYVFTMFAHWTELVKDFLLHLNCALSNFVANIPKRDFLSVCVVGSAKNVEWGKLSGNILSMVRWNSTQKKWMHKLKIDLVIVWMGTEPTKCGPFDRVENHLVTKSKNSRRPLFIHIHDTVYGRRTHAG